MKKPIFNTLDEALIIADLNSSYQAMTTEFNGNKRCWKHRWESELISNTPITEPHCH
jgi:hypothetical protein